MLNINNFCLGISKPLNIFNQDIRSLINLSIKNQIYFHVSISYPLTFYLLRFLISEKKRNEIKFISKILADTEKNFTKSFELTLKNFSIKKLHIVQIVNLPVKNIYNRVYEEINFSEFSKIINKIKLYKETGHIKKNYIQLYPSDGLEFVKKIVNHFDGVCFYANINSIFINEKVYEFIKNNDIPCLILSIFGNPKKKDIKKLNIHSFIFSQKNFSSNTISVGRTYNLKRFQEIINHKFEITNLYNTNTKLVFASRDEYQDTSVNFFKHYKITNILFLFRFLFVCFIKFVLPKTIYNYLKFFKILLPK